MLVMILGDSGSGKTTSLRNLDHEETIIIQCVDKDLPFPKARKNYCQANKNFKVASGYNSIYTTINNLKENDPEGETCKTLFIDDSNYLMTRDWVERASETGYQKFTDLAVNYYYLIEDLKEIAKVRNVYLATHINHLGDGYLKPMTIGKMLDEKVCVEGLFTVVVRSVQDAEGKYRFQIHGNGKDLIKTPMEMFEEGKNYIPNDLVVLNKALDEY